LFKKLPLNVIYFSSLILESSFPDFPGFILLRISGGVRVTKELRYYPKAYVQEFAAEAISFLLRNASMKQLIKGIASMTYLIEQLKTIACIACHSGQFPKKMIGIPTLYISWC